MHIYFADHCRKVSGQHLDATEEIEVLVMPLEQAVSMVMDNEIAAIALRMGFYGQQGSVAYKV